MRGVLGENHFAMGGSAGTRSGTGGGAGAGGGGDRFGDKNRLTLAGLQLRLQVNSHPSAQCNLSEWSCVCEEADYLFEQSEEYLCLG